MIFKRLHTLYASFIKLLNQTRFAYVCRKIHIHSNPYKIFIDGDLPKFCIEKGSEVTIGDNVIIRSGKKKHIIDGVLTRIIVSNNGILKIGNNTGLSNTSIICNQSIEIGNYVNIGAGCLIMDTDSHSLFWSDRLDRVNDIKKSKTIPIKIGDVVFVGARCIICKGVTIGDHSIIAAGSIVTKSIPPGQIWGGNPAKFIRKIDICLD